MIIIEFEPNLVCTSLPPQWRIKYKEDNELEWNYLFLTYEKLKLFLETYCYETNDILELQQFGINTSKIKHNIKL